MPCASGGEDALQIVGGHTGALDMTFIKDRLSTTRWQYLCLIKYCGPS